MSGQELAVVEAPSSALGIFGADPHDVMARVKAAADALAGPLRELGMSLRFQGAERDFVTWAGWQTCAAFFGCTAVVESCERDGPKAYRSLARVYTADARMIGVGIGIASRDEHRLRQHGDHALASMSNTRAQRRALQGVFGWIPGLAGLNVSDPDAPITKRQRTALWTLAGQLGWDPDETHRRAGVASLNDLSREAAGELLEAWASMLDDPGASAMSAESNVEETTEEPVDDRPTEGSASSREPDPPPARSPLEELWVRAIERFGSKYRVLRAYVERFHPDFGAGVESIPPGALRELLQDEGQEELDGALPFSDASGDGGDQP